MSKWKRTKQVRQLRPQHGLAQLVTEKAQRFLGIAKVDIDILSFDYPALREDDLPNEEFLSEIFQTHDCNLSEPHLSIPAIINHAELEKAADLSGASLEQLLSSNVTNLPKLTFPHGTKLLCLYGKNLVDAARKCRHKSHRLWIVELFSDGKCFLSHGYGRWAVRADEWLTDSSPALRSILARRGPLERPMRPGEVFYHILRCQSHVGNEEEKEFWWTQLQSKNQKREVKRLLAQKDFRSAFLAIRNLRALFLDMRLGMIGAILRNKSYEASTHYLRLVASFWTWLLGNNASSCQKLSYKDVKTLELRNPSNSVSDAAFLLPLFQKGEILSRFSPEERDQIWQRLHDWRGLVPSIYTFFEDFKYLDALTKCLKKLVPPKFQQTTYEALKACQVADPDDSSDHISGEPNFPGFDIRKMNPFEARYRRVVHFAMRNLELLRPGSVLLEDEEPKALESRNARAWFDFAAFARRLGFYTTEIAELLSDNPDKLTARQSILKARPRAAFRYEEQELESYADQIAAVYAQIRDDCQQPQRPSMLCAEQGEELQRRCGCPYQRAYEDTCNSLYLSYTSQEDTVGSGELTPFFIRRNIYHAFFGRPSFDDNQCSPEPSGRSFQAALRSPGHESQFETPRPQFNKMAQRLVPDEDNEVHGAWNTALDGSRTSLSHYSRDTSSTISLPRHNDDSVRTHNHGYVEATNVTFVHYHEGRCQVVQELVVADINDTEVNALAASYNSEGIVTMNTNLRSLAPSQCLQAALEDEDHTIILISNEELNDNALSELKQQAKTLKRAASDELIDQNRPRKIHISSVILDADRMTDYSG